MAYLWAAIRTTGILLGTLVALFIVALVTGAVTEAFGYSFVAGCIALAAVFGTLSLFGHQLANIAKIPRTKTIGIYTRLWCGGVAAVSLVVAMASYGYATAQRSSAASDEWPGTPVASGAQPSGLEKGPREDYAPQPAVPSPPRGFVMDGPETRKR
jgi:hypothetical protein